jgi:hypothetical protein
MVRAPPERAARTIHTRLTTRLPGRRRRDAVPGDGALITPPRQ